MRSFFSLFYLSVFLFGFTLTGWAQAIEGNVKEEANNEPMIGALVRVQGQPLGAETDMDGNFKIPYKGKLPVTLIINYVGFDSLVVEVTSLAKPLSLKMKEAQATTLLPEVKIETERVSEKTKNSTQTMVSVGVIEIQQTPAENFYKGLGNLKDVDVTSASMGFTIINTRGFNSTRPVRSLQLIDMVDNQAPGLNFSLGNMVGASELDVQSVDLIVGANSTMYGPGAFNGVVSMTTKNPFIHQGLTFQMKVGERQLMDGAVRYAKAFQNKKGRDVVAFKINGAFMKAYDFEANNLDATSNSLAEKGNLGGYDAINRYGDESVFRMPGYSNVGSAITKYAYRTGYMEKDLADYNTKSIKLQTALHWKITDSLEAIYAYNFGTGTTIYQGDNRFSIKDLVFQQHRVELSGKKFNVKAYTSIEDAGKSYDIVRTAFLMQDAARSNDSWNRAYINQIQRPPFNMEQQIMALPGYVNPNSSPNEYSAFLAQSFVQDSLSAWHQRLRNYADASGTFLNPGNPRLTPGTPQFTEAFRRITSDYSGSDKGSAFRDNSKLYHVQGWYLFTPKWLDIRVGGNFRMFTPQSYGTIFEDSLVTNRSKYTIENGDTVFERNYKVITNWELGTYVNLEKKILNERLRFNVAARLDKNQNFAPIVSPAVSVMYTLKKQHFFRVSFTAAVRNPTLQDQYLYFPLGPAVLLGNLNGRKNVVSIDDYREYLNFLEPKYSFLQSRAYDVGGVKPEKARTFEIGYRGPALKKLYVDGSAYVSFYKDFLGYMIVAQLPDQDPGVMLLGPPIYRVTANAPQTVMTYGASVSLSYFFAKYFEVNGNYSWNRLDKGSIDTTGKVLSSEEKAQRSLLPAFNTPEHKFNIGFNARDIKFNLGKLKVSGLGFNINFKWVEGFRFEGSPMFTGDIKAYYVVDGQVNYHVKKWNTTFKAGASNLTNNPYIQAYGGATIGRMAYFAVMVDIK